MRKSASRWWARVVQVLRMSCLCAVLAGPASAGPDGPGVLVELFTSQGCSSCPPADEVLGEIATLDGVVALSLHVDYWDYLGWRDTFGDPTHTRRQYAYRDAFGARVVFTPQIVVQGSEDAVGTHGKQVRRLIAKARAVQGAPEMSIDSAADGLVLHLAPGTSREGGELWVATYVRSNSVEVKRGENSGRTLSYHNVVRDLRQAGDWSGQEPAAFDLQAPGPGEGIAAWVQRPETGAVLVATKRER